MTKREDSVGDISMSDILMRERSFQTFPEGTFQNVPPTYDRIGLGSRTNRSDSINTCSTVSSETPLVGVKKAARPNLKKICMVTLIAANICTIISLTVALAVVSNAKGSDNNKNCKSNEQTNTTLLPITQGQTSTEMTTAYADTTHHRSDTISTTVQSVDNSTSSNFTPGTWMTWGTWTECTTTCGIGIHSRYRTCGEPSEESVNCQGNYVQKDNCIETQCAVYGIWTIWSPWASCDATCNGGTQSRMRSCFKSDATDLDCVGDGIQQHQCAPWTCPNCTMICSEGDLSPSCEMCICNTSRQGIVITNDNETISNAAVYDGLGTPTLIAYSGDFGTFSAEFVCSGASLFVEKSGYTSQDCHISLTKIVCTVNNNERPIFYQHPQPKARLVGENVTLCCSAESTPNISYYEWMKGIVLVDSSFYPDGKTLTLTHLSKSDSGMYRCRANSEVGSMMSEEANIIVKDTESEFCNDALGQKQIHLPNGCMQPLVETGYCNKQLCQKEGIETTSACREEIQNCCTVADFELTTVYCSGYNLSVITVTACECGNCNYNTVKIVGTVLYFGTGEHVKFGYVYLNGKFVTYTSSKGSFKLSVNKDYGAAVIAVVLNNRQTTKVIDVSEGTTGTIYTNIYIAQETCNLQADTDKDIIVKIGNCKNEMNNVSAVAEIHIQAYSFLDNSFNQFNGTVGIGLTFLNVSDVADLDIMPGLLQSVNDDGKKAPITSVGAFRIRFYDSLSTNSLKLGKNVKLYLNETTLTVYGLQHSSGIWHKIRGEIPAELNELDLKSWINIGKHVNTTKECFFNIRIYDDSSFVSEVTNSKYQLFVQSIHMGVTHSFVTYGHTFNPSRTCFKTICDKNVGFIEVWISNFEHESDEYLIPANPMENMPLGITSAQQQYVVYSVVKDDPHLGLKFTVSSGGPFFESVHACLSSTQTGNHFKFYFPDSVEDIFTLRHFFDLSSKNQEILEHISQRVWYPKRQEGHRVCFVKVRFIIQTDENIHIRVISSGGTNKNISNEILGIRQSDIATSSTLCLEYKCSGTINEDFPDEEYDNTKVIVEYLSSGSATCTIQSFSQELINEFPNINPQNAGENTFTFYAPAFFSPSLGIYSASTSSDDIESARSLAKKECRSGIPMDTSSDNPDKGTAADFTCI